MSEEQKPVKDKSDNGKNSDQGPRCRWIADAPNGRNISNQHDVYTAVEVMPQNPRWTKYVEYSALERAQAEIKTTQHYLKNAQELVEVQDKELAEKDAEIERVSQKAIDWASRVAERDREIERLKIEMSEAQGYCEQLDRDNQKLAQTAAQSCDTQSKLAAATELFGKLEECLDFWAKETEWVNVPAKHQVMRARKALALIAQFKEKESK